MILNQNSIIHRSIYPFSAVIHNLDTTEINDDHLYESDENYLLRAIDYFNENNFFKFSRKLFSITRKKLIEAEKILLNEEIVCAIKSVLVNSRETANSQTVLILLMATISNLWHNKSLLNKNIYRNDIFDLIIVFLEKDNFDGEIYREALHCICYFIQSEENAMFLIEHGTINSLNNFIQKSNILDSSLLSYFFKILSRLYKYLSPRNYNMIYDFTFSFIAMVLDDFYIYIEDKRLLKVASYIVRDKQGYSLLKSSQFFQYFFSISDIFYCNIVKFSSIILNKIVKYDEWKVLKFEELYKSCVDIIYNELHFLHWLKNWPYLCKFLRNSLLYQSKAFYDAGLVDLMKQIFCGDHNSILKINSLSCYCAYLIYSTNDDFVEEIAKINIDILLNFLEDDPQNRSSKWIFQVFLRMIDFGKIDNNHIDSINQLVLEITNPFLPDQRLIEMIHFLQSKLEIISKYQA
ncbi:hypothetical protein TRFO_04964 [Tritrichomonas foetus]|uniref:Uncharacterized protein n=1 Tax=Tritrichomonas foetus TaxID=1144522 RepID=A0A1J4KBJ1_9EUKA|nr:hypothetical protein TRFO_04964 [Tritrichomonas foetus]|eukprot:OHT08338.1 hypothetical protein TRFO_04964 [Tritrichomonas foetus]